LTAFIPNPSALFKWVGKDKASLGVFVCPLNG